MTSSVPNIKFVGGSSTFSEAQQNFIIISNNVTVSLSMLAFLVFYAIMIFLPKERPTFSLKLIYNLFFADLIFTISNILSNFSTFNPTVCQIEGFLKTFSLWASILWSGIISLVAYCRTVKNNRRLDKRYRWFLLIAYGWPLVFAILPLIPGISFYYQTNGVICWISTADPADSVLVKWLYFFCWVWIIIIISTILYILLYCYMRNLGIATRVIEYRRTLIYPVILYVVLIPITIAQTGLLPQYNFELIVAHTFTLHLIGLFNVLAYSFQTMKNTIKMSRIEGLLNNIDQPMQTGPSLPSLIVHRPVAFHEDQSPLRRSQYSAQSDIDDLKTVLMHR